MGAIADSLNNFWNVATKPIKQALEAHTGDGDIHVTAAQKTAWNAKADASDIPNPTTAKPKMDGEAAAGTSTTWAHADHIHPTDTSRASASDLSAHTGDADIHVTATEKAAWNAKEDGGAAAAVQSSLDAHASDTNAHVTAAEKRAWGSKQDAPETAGTAGQVLTLGDDGKPVWADSKGGGGGTITLDSITIATAQDKTDYKAGEVFDPAGMVVTANYAIDCVVIIRDQTVTGYTYPTTGLAAGQEKVVISFTEGGVTATAEADVTVTKTKVAVPEISGTYTYNGNTQTFAFKNEPSSSIATKSGDTSGLAAGPYTPHFALNDTALYEWEDASFDGDVPVTINKATPNVTAPTKAADMTYDGSVRDLTATAGSTDYGTLEYSTDGTTWSTTRPTATDAGSYDVRYRVTGDSNVESVASTSLGAVKIEQKEPTLTVNPSSVTLDADKLTDSSAITTDSDGALSVESSASGVATASLTGKTVNISHVNKTSGAATITVKQAATTNYKAAEATISVTAAFLTIYGVTWDGTAAQTLTRTDAAAGFTDPVPYVAGAASYGSPFDNLAPWKDMVRVTDGEAGEMVKIPKFWYKLTQSGKTLSIQISDAEADGFSVCPACMDRGDGKGERDYVLVGRYHCAAGTYKSATGVKPQVSLKQETFRQNIHNLGANVYMMDFATRFTIWLLYIVEFANWNSQAAIGKGCGNNSAVENMGYTDSMPYHTGTMLSSRDTYGASTQYRYLEGLWDNCYDRLTGCYNASGGLMVEVNPSKFAENSGGVSVGTPANGWIAGLTVSTSGPFPCFINSDTSGGGENVAVGDNWYFYASNPVVFVGGNYSRDGDHGMFCVYYTGLTNTNASLGSRVLKFP